MSAEKTKIILECQSASRFEDEEERSKISNVYCRCGSREFRVCWIPCADTGGYCKITCVVCKSDEILIDDHA